MRLIHHCLLVQLSAVEPASALTAPHAGIRDKINVFKFERDTLERAGVTDTATPIPPFLVVASNDINEDLNAGGWPHCCMRQVAGSLGELWYAL
jgi:hypothetical protein